ncbi:MAG: carboxypeptidase regulatory-like domain-containing protein [Planctomycetota bacterium]
MQKFTLRFCLALVCTAVAPVAHAQLSGVVRDAATQQPVAAAVVRLQATNTATLTSPSGAYSLPGLSGTQLVVVAAKKGYYNSAVTVTTPLATDILLTPVPADDDPTYVFRQPWQCTFCHPDQVSEWTNSPMNLAGNNSWVYDIYNGTGTPGGMGGFVYTRDSHFATTNPNSECAACHQPLVWLEQPGSAMVDSASGHIGYSDGVSCEMCHKVADVDVANINAPGFYPGAVTITRPQGPAFDQVMYGALGDSNFVVTDQMRGSLQPQLQAEVCGACHQDKNDPDEDGNFSEPNGVISEPTYLEWATSPYADPTSPHYATCVDCHMVPTSNDTICDVLSPPLIRSGVRSHDIRGTTPSYLENAVTMTMTSLLVGSEIQATISIHNDLTGHHVPTGVTIRNMILLVEAIRQEDGVSLRATGPEVLPALAGVGDPALGYFAGLPGKLYAKVNHDSSGHGPTFFTDATGILSDNRIAALATDTTNYSFALPSNGGTIELRARLIYRRSWRALVDAKGWTQDGHGQPLADVQAPHFGHLMEQSTATFALPFTPPEFLRGDVDGDGSVQINDPVALLEYLFLDPLSQPACHDAADSNDTGSLNLTDAVYTLLHLFVPGSPAPPSPGVALCGVDPTPDALSCDFFAAAACP